MRHVLIQDLVFILLQNMIVKLLQILDIFRVYRPSTLPLWKWSHYLIFAFIQIWVVGCWLILVWMLIGHHSSTVWLLITWWTCPDSTVAISSMVILLWCKWSEMSLTTTNKMVFMLVATTNSFWIPMWWIRVRPGCWMQLGHWDFLVTWSNRWPTVRNMQVSLIEMADTVLL